MFVNKKIKRILILYFYQKLFGIQLVNEIHKRAP